MFNGSDRFWCISLKLRDYMKKERIILFISTIIISLFGLLMITSSSYIWAEYKFNDPYKFFKNQGFFLVVGTIIMFIVSKFNYKKYYKNTNIIFLITFILLIMVLIPGIGTVRNGSRSWFGIGSFGIQPSEFMKLAIILFISKYMVKNEKNLKNIKKGVFPILGIVTLVFGVIMLQPDFGTGVVMLGAIIMMCVLSKNRFKNYLWSKYCFSTIIFSHLLLP